MTRSGKADSEQQLQQLQLSASSPILHVSWSCCAFLLSSKAHDGLLLPAPASVALSCAAAAVATAAMDLGGIKSLRQTRPRAAQASRTGTITTTTTQQQQSANLASFLTPFRTPSTFTTTSSSAFTASRKRPPPPSAFFSDHAEAEAEAAAETGADAEAEMEEEQKLPAANHQLSSYPPVKVERRDRMTDVHSAPSLPPPAPRRTVTAITPLSVPQIAHVQDSRRRAASTASAEPSSAAPAVSSWSSSSLSSRRIAPEVPFLSIREVKRQHREKLEARRSSEAEQKQPQHEGDGDVQLQAVITAPPVPGPDACLYEPLIVPQPSRPAAVPLSSSSSSVVNYKRFSKVATPGVLSVAAAAALRPALVILGSERGGGSVIDQRLSEQLRREEEVEQLTMDMIDEGLGRVISHKRKR